MRKVLSVIFLSLAGFLLFTVVLCSFLSGLPDGAKQAVLLSFAVAALIPHGIGLAFGGLRHWRRNTAVVLLTVAACGAFSVFTMVCLYASEEFRAMMPPGDAHIFNSFYTGSAVLAGCAALGWWLLRPPAPSGVMPE